MAVCQSRAHRLSASAPVFIFYFYYGGTFMSEILDNGRLFTLIGALDDVGFRLVSFMPDTKPSVYTEKAKGTVRGVTQVLETITLQITPTDKHKGALHG
jgi:hypothetical protein